MNSFLNNDKMRVFAIYGRRRVGKSELINYCLENSNKNYLYYECKQTTEKNNIDSIVDLLCEKYELPIMSFKSFEELLKYIFKLANEEMILVLDEYPYLREVINGLDSIMQTVIDQNKKSKLKIILCGSYIDIMKTLFEHDNPLYGRIEEKIELKPMDYYDSSLFYPDYSYEDKVKLYSVFGGIPYYNNLIDTNKTVIENIIKLIASNGATLENEITGYLKTQLSKINNANEAIEILSTGTYKYNDIYEKSGIEKGPTLIAALDKLVSMGLVNKVSPINDEYNKKKTGYVISDPLTHFFYKYVYKNKSRMMVMDSITFFNKYILEDFNTQYVPKFFEQVAKEYLIRMNKSGKMEEAFDKIGKYYYDNPIKHSNGEFDVVTHDNLGYIFYEVKFKDKPLTKAVIEEEIKQVKETSLNCYKYGFVSKSGFDYYDESLIQISIDEIYNIN